MTNNGGGVTQEQILDKEKPLLYWGVETNPENNVITPYVCCAPTYQQCDLETDLYVDVFEDKKISLPPKIKIVNGFDYKFRSLWGGHE